MPVVANPRAQGPLRVALVVSLVLHAVILFAPVRGPKPASPPSRLTTRLAPRIAKAPEPAPEPTPQVAPQASPRAPQRNVITRKHDAAPAAATVPKFTQAERDEMNGFLQSLESEARAQPSLAQRSLAMAPQIGRETAAESDDSAVSLERIENSPPVNPFSLEMYLDALVTKLNRSASHVKDERRQVGYRKAAVQLRLNPDGTVRSFEILNAGDQFDQINFIKALVERAAPYSPFPPDIVRSAKSMAILICIIPTRSAGGFGFTRNGGGGGC